MGTPKFKLTGGSRIPQRLPARMDIITALEATKHCDGSQPRGAINLYVTFEGGTDTHDPYTAYGRVSLASDNKAIIVPRFEDDIVELGIRDLEVDDEYHWPCGCDSVVRALDDLASTFDSEYDVEVRQDPQQRMGEVRAMLALAEMLGIDINDTPDDARDLLAG